MIYIFNNIQDKENHNFLLEILFLSFLVFLSDIFSYISEKITMYMYFPERLVLKFLFVSSTGTSDPDPCIAGHYCPLGTGLDPVPCPVNTYLDTTGAAVEADCKSCVKGYICNQTGK